MQIAINDEKIHFEAYGQGKPVVYIHGKNSDLRVWYQIVRNLPQDFKHILIDLPNHGKSRTSLKNISLQEYIDFLTKFLNDNDIQEPVLVGHDLGGTIAAGYTIRTKNVSKLVLISTPPIKESLMEIPVETLLIWGELDRNVGVAKAKEMEKGIADAYLRIIWEGEHFPHKEAPSKTAHFIKEFLYE